MRYIELSKSKNQHLEHIEDELFNSGQSGAVKALYFLAGIWSLLSGYAKRPISVGLKWDGSPSLVCGSHPETKEFFVGTKSVFGNSKINYTESDIDNNYQDKPDLAEKLKLALQYLPEINVPGVIQGDLLFGSNLSAVDIDRRPYICFRPNTITYAVPKNSKLGEVISQAKIGIIFHTEYVGDTMPDLSARYNFSSASLTPSPNVWFADAKFTPNITSDTDLIKAMLIDARNNLKNILTENWFVFEENTEFRILFKSFINVMVREGRIDNTPISLITRFIKYYANRMQKTEKMIRQSAIQVRLQKIQNMQDFLDINQSGLSEILSLFLDVVKIKTLLLTQLCPTHDIKAFLVSNGPLQPTAPEGFVATDRLENAVKLVDRLTFSRANFLRLTDHPIGITWDRS